MSAVADQAGRVADFALVTSVTAFLGVSIADALLIAQLVVTVLSGIGVIVAIWYHLKAGRRLK